MWYHNLFFLCFIILIFFLGTLKIKALCVCVSQFHQVKRKKTTQNIVANLAQDMFRYKPLASYDTLAQHAS